MPDLWFLEASVCAGLEVAEVAEYTLFELFHVDDGSTECFKAKYERADNIGAGDVVESRPEDARDVLAGREQKAVESGMR